MAGLVGSAPAGSSAPRGSAVPAGSGGWAEPVGLSASRDLACSNADRPRSGFEIAADWVAFEPGPPGFSGDDRSVAAPMLRRAPTGRSQQRHKEDASFSALLVLREQLHVWRLGLFHCRFETPRPQGQCSSSPVTSTQSCLRSSQTEKRGIAKKGSSKAPTGMATSPSNFPSIS